MADVNANINIDINSSGAIADLRKLQSQIGEFNQSVITSNTAAAAAQRQLNSQLINQVSAIKGFSSSIVTVQSDLSRLGTAIDKNRLSLTEYFRYAGGASKTFGKMFTKEHNDVMALAEDRVKRLNTQYVALGESQNGMTRALATRPLQLNNADLAISTQRQQLFNKLLRDGSTSMLNWGKNTQWAGRQLMVGFTVPVTMFGTIAGKVFMDLEKQIINFRRVYGDLGTTVEESEAMVAQVQTLGKEYTKYGIAVSDTIGLAAKAAAAGAQGADLIAATEQATRLATLGQVDQNQALTATIALQSAFEIGAKDLASTIDFLNAVENQTVVSLDDITIAIPKVAPVIRGLGGDVKDLSIFLAAMREGGVNAAEGANALKSGLASMINPTKAASEVLKGAGINMKGLIQENKGDLLGLVQDFGAALQNLDKFSRQQVLAKVFGKYQFARMGALFENINKDASQAQRVIDLAGESMEDLAKLSEKELGSIENAVSVKFIGAVEKLKLAIAPVGKKFMEIATPIIEFTTKIAEKFSELPEGMKTFIIAGTAIGAILIPSIIMLIGLMANFLGNMLKVGTAFRGFLARIRGGGDAFNYYEQQELDAMAASASLDAKVTKLTTDINLQRTAVNKLATAYGNMATAARNATTMLPQGFRRPSSPRRMAQGGTVPGSGNGDTVAAMLTPGEFVVNKKAAKENSATLQAMNSGRLKGYEDGGLVEDRNVNVYPDIALRTQRAGENSAQKAGQVVPEDILSVLALRVGEARGMKPTQSQVKAGKFDEVAKSLEGFASDFVTKLKKGFDETYADIQDTDERFATAWKNAGREVEADISNFPEQQRKVMRQYVGLDEDFYGTIPTGPREKGGSDLSRGRRGAFKRGKEGFVRSFAAIRQPAFAMRERLTGESSKGLNMGHVFKPKQVPLGELANDPYASFAPRAAIASVQNSINGVTAGAEAAVGRAQQSNSPSKKGQALGESLANGYAIGIEKQSAKVKGAAAGMAMAAMNATRTQQQSRPIIDPSTMPVATGFIPPMGGGPSSPIGGRGGGGGDEEGKKGKGLSGVATKLSAVSIAATMAAGAFASMGGPVGEVANNIFPLLGFLDLITIPLMFIGGGGGAAAGGGLAAFGAAAAGALGPITLIVAGLAALIASFKITYDRFEPLREAVSQFVDTLKAVVGAIVGEVVGAFKQMFGITDKAGSAFGGFGDILQNIANFLGPVFTAVVKVATFQIQYLGNVIKIIIKYFQIVFNIFKMAATIIVKSLIKGFQLLAGAFGWIIDKLGPLGAGFKLFGKMVGDTFSKIPELVKNAFSTVTGWIETAVNGAIAAVNFLIEKYNSLPEWMRGDKIDVIADITLKYNVVGSIPSAESLGNAYGNDYQAGKDTKPGKYNPEGTDTVDDTSSGSKEKSWLEQQNADIAANTKLYLDGQKIAQKYSVARTGFDGIFARLRGMGVSQQILDALGTGEEGVKNAKELLKKNKSGIIQFVKDFGNANILGPAVEEARKKIAENADKKKAGGLIDASIFGFTKEQKDALLGDQNVIAAINQAALQGKGPLNEYLGMLKATADAADPVDLFQQKVDDLSLAQRLQTKPLEDQIDAYQKQIDKVNEEINAIQELNSADQDRISTLDRQKEMIQRQIDALERQNELDQRRIESLNREDALRQRTSDAISHELDQMSKRENEIKSTYDNRIKALEDISKINQHLIDQQKQQLGLAQAFSQGDVYAAAQAAQEIQASQANYASDQMKAGMQQASENAIAGLTTSGGLTRTQAEQQIADIKEQSYQTSLLVRDIEDVIYERNQQIIPLKDQQLNIDMQIRDINDIIYGREQEIKSIQDQKLDPLNKALKAQQDIKKSIDDTFKAQIDDLNLRKDLAELTTDEADRVYNLAQQWKAVGDQIAAANKAAEEKLTKLGDMPQQNKYKNADAWQTAVTKWNKAKAEVEASRVASVQAVATPYKGGLMKYATGSIVGSGGRDSIPALLTPGEFVVRKSMVDKYGPSMLSKINQGAFSMPRYNVGGKMGAVNARGGAGSTAPVYNTYSVNVPVNNPGASADEIANVVMTKIRSIDNSSVRRINGY